MYEYRARITRVVDGDTVHALVDLGCDVTIALTVRLYGIDAPELPTIDGVAAREWLSAQIGAVGGVVTLRTVKDRREKYGRYLGTLIVGGVDLNAQMVALGFAEAYP